MPNKNAKLALSGSNHLPPRRDVSSSCKMALLDLLSLMMGTTHKLNEIAMPRSISNKHLTVSRLSFRRFRTGHYQQ